jgi:predicted nucleotidyltransferase
LSLPYVVIGATARDLVLHHHYGAKIERATQDVDFGIQVPDWSAFEALRQALLERGYKDTRKMHRLISPADDVVDIVPFGEVQQDGSKIAWPPSGEIEMTVLGLAEALQTAVRVSLSADTGLTISVATPVGRVQSHIADHFPVVHECGARDRHTTL